MLNTTDVYYHPQVIVSIPVQVRIHRTLSMEERATGGEGNGRREEDEG